MTIKGFAAAQRHKGGFKKWCYDMIKSLNDSAYDDTALKGRVKDVEDAIGASDTAAGSLKKRCKDIETAIGTESTEGTILYRIKALETAAAGSGGSGSGGGGSS